MQTLLRTTPQLYLLAVVLSIAFAIFSWFVQVFLVKEHTPIDIIWGPNLLGILYGIAALFPWVSGFVGTLASIFTIVQLAVLDLHTDKEKQIQEEKKRWARLLLLLFILVCLAITPRGAVMVIEVGQKYGWIPEQIFALLMMFFMHAMAWFFWFGFRRNNTI